MTIDKLTNKIKKYDLKCDIKLLKKAYDFAKNKHVGQKRLSGEEYISHPYGVALILADLELDCTTIIAGLLHDVLEDTKTDKEEIVSQFGEKVAELVAGVTKLGEVDLSRVPKEGIQNDKTAHEIENLRKLFLAMSEDIRVIVLKLADRMHNMRTLEYRTKEDQARIARETMEIYSPIADRLGMGDFKAELDDLSFSFLLPQEYKKLAQTVKSTEKEREHYLSKMKKVVLKTLKENNIEAQIDSRIKHFWSIYKKLDKVNGDFSKIYDLSAVRIIVGSVEDCYKVLGIIHKEFKPLIYRIKDYIAVPKPNGYRSLHTTVFGLDGKITEFQIRTQKMHQEAERGIAAHWHYSENKDQAYKGGLSAAPTAKMEWVGKVLDWQQNINDNEFRESLNIDIFSDRIFVFSPKGEIFDLPEGATPVDFAYELHTQIGHKARGAKVNGKMVQLDYKLENRDVVEIILSSKNDKSGPSRGWLDFVKTAKAKQNIRSFFKKINRTENIKAGKKMLSDELAMFGMVETDITGHQIHDLLAESTWKDWQDSLASIGEGAVSASQVLKRLIGQKIYFEIEANPKEKTSDEATGSTEDFANLSGILVRYAACCQPKSGDKTKGFITQGQGITIHRADCPNLLASPQEKVINVDILNPSISKVQIMIEADDRIGFLRDVTHIISDEKVNIENIRNEDGQDKIKVLIDLVLKNPDKLADLLHRISRVEGVTKVKKQ